MNLSNISYVGVAILLAILKISGLLSWLSWIWIILVAFAPTIVKGIKKLIYKNE